MARLMARVPIRMLAGTVSVLGEGAQLLCPATFFACGAGDGNRTRTVSLGMVTVYA